MYFIREDLLMTEWDYRKGLHDIGKGIYAYLQPDGSWGLSNAGLIVDGGESILIDTLFDLLLTGAMLKTMAATTKAARVIDKLVITHANPDHYNGNQLVEGAEIIASKACAEEMDEMPPQSISGSIKSIPGKEELKTYMERCFGQFHFDNITLVPPTRTFEQHLDIKAGNKEIHLIEVGRAHTRGDIIVHVPEDQVVFAGDLLFVGGTPIFWVGPVDNWLSACDLMLEMDAKVFVPGHGPITDKEGVIAIKGYLEYISEEAKKRYDAGFDPDEAVADISLGKYRSWADSERIVVNVHTLYKQFSGDNSSTSVLDLFEKMAQFVRREFK
jgi:glyoxylase-like metal-dependent hydrolase (beta-lactamase superfamily II)